MIYYIQILTPTSTVKQSGAVEACWAHNPEVRGSKPRSAKHFANIFFSYLSVSSNSAFPHNSSLHFACVVDDEK